MEVRFKKKSEIFDVAVTAIGGTVSVGTMLYGVWKLGLKETWPELVLNVFYIACLLMMAMYFFKIWIRPTITYGLVACFVSEAEGDGPGPA